MVPTSSTMITTQGARSTILRKTSAPSRAAATAPHRTHRLAGDVWRGARTSLSSTSPRDRHASTAESTDCAFVGWLSRHVHDPGGIVLRRGVAAGVTVTAVYALGVEVVDDSTFALFAAFSGFAVYGLVWFGGTTAHRAAGYLSYAATG